MAADGAKFEVVDEPSRRGGFLFSLLIAVLIVICAGLVFRIAQSITRRALEREYELDRAFRVLATGNDEERAVAVGIIKSRGPDALDMLSGMLGNLDNGHYAREVVFLLGETGSPGAIEPLARELARRDPQTYVTAVSSLRKIAATSGPVVAAMIRDDVFKKAIIANPIDAEGMIDYFAEYGDGECAAIITAFLEDESNALKAIYALVKLARRLPEETGDIVEIDEKYLDDPRHFARLGAAEIFAINRDERGVGALISFLASERFGAEDERTESDLTADADDAARIFERLFGESFGYDVLKSARENSSAVILAKKWFEENRGKIFKN